MYRNDPIINQNRINSYFQLIKYLKKISIKKNEDSKKNKKNKKIQKNTLYQSSELQDKQSTLNRLVNFLIQNKDILIVDNKKDNQFDQNKELLESQERLFFYYLQGAYCTATKEEKIQVIGDAIAPYLNAVSKELQTKINIIKNILKKIQQLYENQFEKIDFLNACFTKDEAVVFEENRVLIKIILKSFEINSTLLAIYRNFYTNYSGKHKAYISNYLDSAKIFYKSPREYVFYLINKDASYRAFNRTVLINKEKNPLYTSNTKEFLKIIDGLGRVKSKIFIKKLLLKLYLRQIIDEEKIINYYNHYDQDIAFLKQIVTYKGKKYSNAKKKQVGEDIAKLLNVFLPKINIEELNALIDKKFFMNLLLIALKSSSRQILLSILFKEFNKELYIKLMPFFSTEERSYYLEKSFNVHEYTEVLLALIDNQYEFNLPIENDRVLPIENYKVILNKFKTLTSNSNRYLTNDQSTLFKKILPDTQYNSFFSNFPGELKYLSEDFLSLKQIIDLVHQIYHLNLSSKVKLLQLVDLHGVYNTNFGNEEYEFLSSFILNIGLILSTQTTLQDQIHFREYLCHVVSTNKFIVDDAFKFINYRIFNDYIRFLSLDNRLDSGYSNKTYERYENFKNYLDNNSNKNLKQPFHRKESYIFSQFKDEYKVLINSLLEYIDINKAGLQLDNNSHAYPTQIQNLNKNKTQIESFLIDLQKSQVHIADALLEQNLAPYLTITNLKLFDSYIFFHSGIFIMRFIEGMYDLSNFCTIEDYQFKQHDDLNQILKKINKIIYQINSLYSDTMIHLQLTKSTSKSTINVCFNPILLLKSYYVTTYLKDLKQLNKFYKSQNSEKLDNGTLFQVLNTANEYLIFLLNSSLISAILVNTMNSINENIIEINSNKEEYQAIINFINNLIEFFTNLQTTNKESHHIMLLNLKVQQTIFTNVETLKQNALKALIGVKKILQLDEIKLDNKLESLPKLLEIYEYMDDDDADISKNLAISKRIKQIIQDMLGGLMYQLKDKNKAKVSYLITEFTKTQEELTTRNNTLLSRFLKEVNLSDDEGDEEEIIKNCTKYRNCEITTTSFEHAVQDNGYISIRRIHMHDSIVYQLHL